MGAGQVAEWLKALAWKACIRETVSWVRIPPCPPHSLDAMDHSTKSIAEFATRLSYADLPAELVHDCKRRIVDTIGCAIAAFDEEPVAHRARRGDARAGLTAARR